MIVRIIRYFSISIIFLCVCTGSTAANEKDVLPLITGEWPPYSSKLLKGYGVQVEIVSVIVREMGMVPEFQFLPWKRGKEWVRLGKAFATFPYTYTKDRAETFDFSDPIYYTKTVFFYFKDNMTKISYDSFSDLKDYRIGGVLGYSYVKRFETAGLKHVSLVPLDKQLIPMLGHKRVDLVAMDHTNGWLEIDKHYPHDVDRFGVLDKSLSGISDSRLMISRAYPNHKALRTRFNEAFKRLKKKPSFQKLLNKYGTIE